MLLPLIWLFAPSRYDSTEETALVLQYNEDDIV
jgi:hypothetical protein